MIELIYGYFFHAIVCFARIAGCFLLLPGFSSVRVPQHIRIIFVLALTAALLPNLPQTSPLEGLESPPSITRLLFFETVTGALIGLSVRYYVLAIGFTITAASASIGYTSQFAPSILDSDMEPALGSIVSTAVLILMFAMDFHHSIIRGLVESFSVIPLGTAPQFGALGTDITNWLRDSFLVVFNLGSPFFIYSLTANIFIALINKLVPSLPVYFVMTPAVLYGGLVVAYYVLPAYLSFLAQGIFELAIFK